MLDFTVCNRPPTRTEGTSENRFFIDRRDVGEKIVKQTNKFLRSEKRLFKGSQAIGRDIRL